MLIDRNDDLKRELQIKEIKKASGLKMSTLEKVYYNEIAKNIIYLNEDNKLSDIYDDSSDIMQEVEDILGSEEKFDYIEEILDHYIVGERNNKLLALVLLVGSYVGYFEIILIVGDSASGKTHLADQVLALLPKDHVFKITGSSDKAIFYREWKERILSFNEIQRNTRVIEQLKAMGDDGIIYMVVLKDKHANPITKEIKIGKMAIIGTTTNINLNTEFPDPVILDFQRAFIIS